MANKTITDYVAAVTIDAVNDYLLLEQSGAYKKINRDVLLGITGNPVGSSDSQTLSNKTIGNTNTVTLKDTLFTLQDDGDTTKQAQFQLSGITTATTRTITVPDASLTLVGTATTQTLTNKTLTGPAITGGTIANSTITVDSIAEYTSANGVTIDGVKLKDGALATNNSVVTSNITDAAVTPAKLQSGTGSGWSWQSWTPTWTNLSLGNGTVTARYIQTGKLITYRLALTFGSTTSISAQPNFTLPATAVNPGSSGTASIILGEVWYEDNGVANYRGVVSMGASATSTTGALSVYSAGSTYVQMSAMSATVPFTFGNGDLINIYGYYETT